MIDALGIRPQPAPLEKFHSYKIPEIDLVGRQDPVYSSIPTSMTIVDTEGDSSGRKSMSASSTPLNSVPNTEIPVCQCGLCSPLRDISTASPAFSTASTCQSDMSPPSGTMWPTATSSDTSTNEAFRPPFNGSYLETSQCLDNLIVPDMLVPCLNDQSESATYNFAAPFNFFNQSMSTSSSPESTCLPFGPIGTIATKNEVSKHFDLMRASELILRRVETKGSESSSSESIPHPSATSTE